MSSNILKKIIIEPNKQQQQIQQYQIDFMSQVEDIEQYEEILEQQKLFEVNQNLFQMHLTIDLPNFSIIQYYIGDFDPEVDQKQLFKNIQIDPYTGLLKIMPILVSLLLKAIEEESEIIRIAGLVGLEYLIENLGCTISQNFIPILKLIINTYPKLLIVKKNTINNQIQTKLFEIHETQESQYMKTGESQQEDLNLKQSSQYQDENNSFQFQSQNEEQENQNQNQIQNQNQKETQEQIDKNNIKTGNFQNENQNLENTNQNTNNQTQNLQIIDHYNRILDSFLNLLASTSSNILREIFSDICIENVYKLDIHPNLQIYLLKFMEKIISICQGDLSINSKFIEQYYNFQLENCQNDSILIEQENHQQLKASQINQKSQNLTQINTVLWDKALKEKLIQNLDTKNINNIIEYVILGIQKILSQTNPPKLLIKVTYQQEVEGIQDLQQIQKILELTEKSNNLQEKEQTLKNSQINQQQQKKQQDINDHNQNQEKNSEKQEDEEEKNNSKQSLLNQIDDHENQQSINRFSISKNLIASLILNTLNIYLVNLKDPKQQFNALIQLEQLFSTTLGQSEDNFQNYSYPKTQSSHTNIQESLNFDVSSQNTTFDINLIKNQEQQSTKQTQNKQNTENQDNQSLSSQISDKSLSDKELVTPTNKNKNNNNIKKNNQNQNNNNQNQNQSLEYSDSQYLQIRLNCIFEFWPIITQFIHSPWSNIRSLAYSLLCNWIRTDIKNYNSNQQQNLLQKLQEVLQILLSSNESESRTGGLNILGSFCGLSQDFSQIKIYNQYQENQDLDIKQKQLLKQKQQQPLITQKDQLFLYFQRNSTLIDQKIWELVFNIQFDWDITNQAAAMAIIQLCAPQITPIKFGDNSDLLTSVKKHLINQNKDNNNNNNNNNLTYENNNLIIKPNLFKRDQETQEKNTQNSPKNIDASQLQENFQQQQQQQLGQQQFFWVENADEKEIKDMINMFKNEFKPPNSLWIEKINYCEDSFEYLGYEQNSEYQIYEENQNLEEDNDQYQTRLETQLLNNFEFEMYVDPQQLDKQQQIKKRRPQTSYKRKEQLELDETDLQEMKNIKNNQNEGQIPSNEIKNKNISNNYYDDDENINDEDLMDELDIQEINEEDENLIEQQFENAKNLKNQEILKQEEEKGKHLQPQFKLNLDKIKDNKQNNNQQPQINNQRIMVQDNQTDSDECNSQNSDDSDQQSSEKDQLKENITDLKQKNQQTPQIQQKIQQNQNNQNQKQQININSQILESQNKIQEKQQQQQKKENNQDDDYDYDNDDNEIYNDINEDQQSKNRQDEEKEENEDEDEDEEEIEIKNSYNQQINAELHKNLEDSNFSDEEFIQYDLNRNDFDQKQNQNFNSQQLIPDQQEHLQDQNFGNQNQEDSVSLQTKEQQLLYLLQQSLPENLQQSLQNNDLKPGELEKIMIQQSKVSQLSIDLQQFNNQEILNASKKFNSNDNFKSNDSNLELQKQLKLLQQINNLQQSYEDSPLIQTKKQIPKAQNTQTPEINNQKTVQKQNQNQSQNLIQTKNQQQQQIKLPESEKIPQKQQKQEIPLQNQQQQNKQIAKKINHSSTPDNSKKHYRNKSSDDKDTKKQGQNVSSFTKHKKTNTLSYNIDPKFLGNTEPILKKENMLRNNQSSDKNQQQYEMSKQKNKSTQKKKSQNLLSSKQYQSLTNTPQKQRYLRKSLNNPESKLITRQYSKHQNKFRRLLKRQI
ncbi:Armadillo-type fold [Pseudocohnilembus persalinus]|uniref:Armadillo-type fold n=1 Tax=Pseudocohnilembus persalinus TaxID=266149 RepID=A0A0V0R0E4_PSEPJ|nr:Armadillo-type fold [Pseudocohnilembus persalinus]|eukprot:KRX07972.1 Armadillo-type fold [Pseudocohnilembus persalinus]